MDNEKNHHPHIVTTLRQIVSINNLVKSVKDVQTAMKLLYEIIRMYTSGGFKLMKIISNRVDVVQSATETKRRKGARNVDLNNGIDLLKEKTLGVEWNVKNDQLGFTVNLGEKPFRRCGSLSVINKIYYLLGLAAPFLLKTQIIFQALCKNNYNCNDTVTINLNENWES